MYKNWPALSGAFFALSLTLIKFEGGQYIFAAFDALSFVCFIFLFFFSKMSFE